MDPQIFDSEDLDEIEDYFSQIWGKMRLGAGGEHTRAQVTHRGFGAEVAFDDADYSFDIAWSASPPDQLIISEVVGNTISLEDKQREGTFGPGDQFVVAQPGVPYEGVARATRLRLTAIDPALFDQVASTGGSATEPVTLLDHRPISHQAHLRLQRTITYLSRELQALDEPSPLIVSTASQYLAASILSTYPNTAISDPTATDRRDATPSAVERALAYIEAYADLPLTLADIASAACVTPRALQLAFQRHLDTTPMAYLRRVRLDCAHRELLDANDGFRVADVAYRWGFSSPGRFARYYRAAYGNNPSDTLRAATPEDTR
jgi:AraC-like DNA-binding protein